MRRLIPAAILLVLLLLSAGIALYIFRDPLPPLSTVPPFTLTAEDGRAFDSAQLRGHVWAADLIFTNCPSICPRMSGEMHRIQSETTTLRLVSFTVDPDRDTPPVLAAYARRHKADPARWSFLTGPREELDKVSQAFLFGKIHIDHSSRFVLVDKQMRVRGFYNTDEHGAVEELIADAAKLQQE